MTMDDQSLATLLPERRSDPVTRAETYIDRELGADDPVKERRELRAMTRAAHVIPESAIINTQDTSLNAGAMDEGRFYRVRNAGVKDSIYARVKAASGTIVAEAVALWGDVLAQLTFKSNVGHTHGIAVTTASAGVAIGAATGATVTATCGGRSVATGCGWGHDGPLNTVVPYICRPSGDTQCVCGAYNGHGGTINFTTYARCLTSPTGV
jgi:hypothetical protein